ncbi:MAG: 50S ribosomal protein L9 [Paludibacter sp.]|nr:50S ribosomal protein L9 [Bacteroidales bacterium]MCM1069362.1 50S ribosomal protein L9 [Prevotella sp.]MCM1353882.1 50S ribosomal protein L9 [Bacteroides sp.]MCM1442868.1 50S ribosomal protein L9 [Muribaculum sp.]MCM1481913.1 50S ribosomal protein L9 [Paludibacter sp.]
MEVILIENVANLGYKDDIVKVRDGYGRNYLIPNKLAVIASESARKVLAENLKQRAHKLEKIKADAVALAEKLNALTLTIGAKASENGKIFGAVTPLQLAEALEAQGLNVDRRTILIAEPVKELGEYTAQARLHKEVSAEIKFTVVAE